MDKPIGEILVDMGALDRIGLDRALLAQREHGGRLGDILRSLGLVSDLDWARALSLKADVPLAEPADYPAAPLFAGRVSEKFLKEMKILPLAETEEGIVLAMADPLDRYAAEAMSLVADAPVVPRVGTERDIEAALARLYQSGRSTLTDIVDDIGDDTAQGGDEDIERLRDMASEAPVIRLVNLILTRAMEARASDIHVEPFENTVVVRYRIDGILRDVESPPGHLTPALISRIKIMARLNIAERRLAQDGRICVRLQGKAIDLRVSTVPSLYGESVVIRLLEHDPVALEFSALGLADTDRAILREALGHHHGIMLVTGPTGSGKTTTLYAALTHLNSTERKIVTVEDPVEYQINRVTQIQVNAGIGLTFANLLRSIVRHDPDVIMIGEMRDGETAEIAVQSALTGHLVLSTLHTNDAPSAITRMLDMGVEDYLLVSTVNAILAQRLVRTLCEDCRQPYAAPAELVDRFGLDRFGANGNTLYRAEGCDICGGFGYVGRMGIFEVMPVNEEIRRLVLQHADSTSLQSAAVEAGMSTMFEDGIRKAVAGVTTIEEVRRVTREM